MSAFVNTNGTLAVPVVNAAHFTYDASINVGAGNYTTATAYLTDNEHNVTMVDQIPVQGGVFSTSVEPRAMKTFFLQ